MAGYFNDEIEPGDFLPTTGTFDPQSIQELQLNSTTFKEFLVNLQQAINNHALAINRKDCGIYSTTQFISGQLWYPNPSLFLAPITTNSVPYRQGYRIVIDFGALPNNATKTVAHGLTIDTNFTSTRIFACATKPVGGAFSFLPIPYVSTAGDAIELFVDGTNISITTQSDRTAWTRTSVVFEWLVD